jgi:ApaG protein
MANKARYECTVVVETHFIVEQSDVEQNRYAFAYVVKITNTGSVAAQLISRHWVITNSANQVQEVKGLGVVGAQPLINPNGQFKYSSGTVLTTPTGTMHGTYQMVAEDGTQFEAIIAPFSLAMPRVLH